MSDLPLEKLAHMPTLVIDALDGLAIGPELFRGVEVAEKAVLVRAGWSKHWRSDAYVGRNPHLTEDTCKA